MHLRDSSLFCVLISLEAMCSPNNLFIDTATISFAMSVIERRSSISVELRTGGLFSAASGEWLFIFFSSFSYSYGHHIFSGCIISTLENNVFLLYARLKSTTLVMVGPDDVWTPAPNSLMIAEKIPAAWLVQIRDAGHGLMYQYPDKISRIVTTYCRQLVSLYI